MQIPCQLGFTNMTAEWTPGYVDPSGEFHRTGQTLIFPDTMVPEITPEEEAALEAQERGLMVPGAKGFPWWLLVVLAAGYAVSR